MIVYYNVHHVSNLIEHNLDAIENSPFLAKDFDKKIFDTYDKIGLNRFNAVYDRTNSLPHFLNISKDLHPIPSHVVNDSFFEVSKRRAKELLDLGQPINVMWSGGIDSTYILFILRHFANDPDQVRIYGTYNSIIESGDMFDRRLKNEFKYHIDVSKRNDLKYQEPGIYVSGMCGNQLFGPTDDMFATGGTAMFHHTLGTPETIYESYTNVNPEILEFLDPIIKSSPKKIETVADLRWLCIFNLDWYTALYEHKVLLNKPTADKIHGFFNSEDFQSWAINTKEPFTKIRGNPNTHRWQMREILSDMFGEKHYADNKSKKISNFSLAEPNWLFLLENGDNVFL
jgi:hypothetical protein